jgi:hypothetical protein
MTDRKAIAREIAARTTPRFIEIKRKKRGFTKEELHRLKHGPDWAELEFERARPGGKSSRSALVRD